MYSTPLCGVAPGLRRGGSTGLCVVVCAETYTGDNYRSWIPPQEHLEDTPSVFMQDARPALPMNVYCVHSSHCRHSTSQAQTTRCLGSAETQQVI